MPHRCTCSPGLRRESPGDSKQPRQPTGADLCTNLGAAPESVRSRRSIRAAAVVSTDGIGVQILEAVRPGSKGATLSSHLHNRELSEVILWPDHANRQES